MHIDKTIEIIYTYDNNGNILTKSVNGEVTEYKYKENTDQLANFVWEYDNMGNPKDYRQYDCNWYNGKLTSLCDGDVLISYAYDGFGLRTSKTVGSDGTTINYTYDSNGNLVKEVGSRTIEYIYGADGIIGIKVNNVPYLFRKNLFGDVTHIYNENGTLVGKYSYTAFGKCTIEQNTSNIASLNPIRYRSYYYDTETNYYYLKSRYYDPELGRFISIDSIEYIDPETINGLNLYAYCGNNPVMFTDPNGTSRWWEWLLAGLAIVACAVGAVFTGGASLVGAALIGAAIGGTISVASQAITTGELNWGQFALDMGIGFISGAVGASGISKLGSVIVGGLVGGTSSILSDVVNGQEINWTQFAVSVVLGSAAGAVSGAGARNVKHFSKTLGGYSSWNKAMSSFYGVQGKIASGSYATVQGMKGALRFVNLALDKAYLTSFNVHIAKNISRMLIINGVGTGVNAFINGVFGW